MKDLHPDIRKYWENQGETIIFNDNCLYTIYSLKNDKDSQIEIARFSKIPEDEKYPDMYWLSKEENEMSCSELVAVRKIKLLAFL
jgi:hypothetical protein